MHLCHTWVVVSDHLITPVCQQVELSLEMVFCRAKEIADSRSSSDPLPITDIDQLAKSMDDEAFSEELASPEEPNNETVNEWLNAQTPAHNGHSVTEQEGWNASDDLGQVSDEETSRRTMVSELTRICFMRAVVSVCKVIVSQK